MTVVLRHNETLELNLVEFTGAVTVAQLQALAGYGARHLPLLRNDAIHLIGESADFGPVDLSQLDALFADYRKLYEPLTFQIYRRSVWLCFSQSAEAHVAYWIGDRDLREGMSSTVRRFGTMAEACDWLVLSPAEAADVERGVGFTDLAVFDDAPPRLTAAG